MKYLCKEKSKPVRRSPLWVMLLAALLCSLPLTAAILPEDQVDSLYHSYEGGGVSINGPSVTARSEVGKNTSMSAHYYVDSISSASIDVETFASPYTERREEYSISMEHINDNSNVSLAYTSSEESDYVAGSYHLGISHSIFGDLTTVSLGYSRGFDSVRRNIYDTSGPVKYKQGSAIVGSVDRHQFRFGVTQILSKNLIANLGLEVITDEGYLNNPYRSVFYRDASLAVLTTTEQYPGTRTSSAVSLRARYHLPWRAAMKFEVRSYTDSWDIRANMFDLGFTQPLGQTLIMDFHFRQYSQGAASFYSNYFDSKKVFMARDKELSSFSSTTIGGGVSYEFMNQGWWKFDKGTVNTSLDLVRFDYDNYRDVRDVSLADESQIVNAPRYSFTAKILQIYMSLWY
ncbi:MAG: DUF3570 domain-containing protein [Gammaproteobacteria bacterium]|nr:DUF3570 domain-containing protein [Gammaproteobacteria bacterium]MDH5802067.1 DUF3570 domain-containing protein [Gammaproteobacteria bacterium]